MVPAQPQSARGHEELLRVEVAGGRLPAVEAGEKRAARRVVDGAPVVGVDEGEVDDLGALVDVGHARHRQLDELLPERDRARGRVEVVAAEAADQGQQVIVGEDRVDEGDDRAVVLLDR